MLRFSIVHARFRIVAKGVARSRRAAILRARLDDPCWDEIGEDEVDVCASESDDAKQFIAFEASNGPGQGRSTREAEDIAPVNWPASFIGGPITVYDEPIVGTAGNFWPYSGWPVEYPPVSESKPLAGKFPSQAMGERDPNAWGPIV